MNNLKSGEPISLHIDLSLSARTKLFNIFIQRKCREHLVLMTGSRSDSNVLISEIYEIPNKARTNHVLHVERKVLEEKIHQLGEDLIATAHNHSEIPSPSYEDANLFSSFSSEILHFIVKEKNQKLNLHAYYFLGEQSLNVSQPSCDSNLETLAS